VGWCVGGLLWVIMNRIESKWCRLSKNRYTPTFRNHLALTSEPFWVDKRQCVLRFTGSNHGIVWALTRFLTLAIVACVSPGLCWMHTIACCHVWAHTMLPTPMLSMYWWIMSTLLKHMSDHNDPASWWETRYLYSIPTLIPNVIYYTYIWLWWFFSTPKLHVVHYACFMVDIYSVYDIHTNIVFGSCSAVMKELPVVYIEYKASKTCLCIEHLSWIWCLLWTGFTGI